jgi:hypothetical protein
MSDSQIILSIAILLWPVCLLIIIILFRKEISALLNRCITPRVEEKKQHEVSSKAVTKTDTVGKRGETDLEDEYIPVVRNKNTNLYFIVLEDNDGGDEYKLINPEPRILDQRKDNYHAIERVSSQEIEKQNPEQLQKYYKYIESDQSRIASQPTKKRPFYLSSYIRMLESKTTLPSRMFRIITENGKIEWGDLRQELNELYGYQLNSGSMGASLKALETLGMVKISGNGGNNKTIIVNNE